MLCGGEWPGTKKIALVFSPSVVQVRDQYGGVFSLVNFTISLSVALFLYVLVLFPSCVSLFLFCFSVSVIVKLCCIVCFPLPCNTEYVVNFFF